MSLKLGQAEFIAGEMGKEFNSVSSIYAKRTLEGSYQVFIDHRGFSVDPAVERQMQDRACELAGRPLTKDELVFKTGKHF